MSIQADIHWISTQLQRLNDPDLVLELKGLLLRRSSDQDSDWWQNISEEDKAAIREGLEDVKAGRVKPLEEVLKRFK